MDMKKYISFTAVFALLCIAASLAAADGKQRKNNKISKFELGKSKIYRKGWIDFNKNGVKDVYEDPDADIDDRIEDLLRQMTVEEKTCQMVTLYGYRRVLADDLPTPEWKDKLWKDGIGAIDEHLNGFYGWGLP